MKLGNNPSIVVDTLRSAFRVDNVATAAVRRSPPARLRRYLRYRRVRTPHRMDTSLDDTDHPAKQATSISFRRLTRQLPATTAVNRSTIGSTPQRISRSRKAQATRVFRPSGGRAWTDELGLL